MLVKFSTRYGQLLMQGEPAVALVKLGGHSGTVPSAVLAADLPTFAAKLRAGLELHGDARVARATGRGSQSRRGRRR